MGVPSLPGDLLVALDASRLDADQQLQLRRSIRQLKREIRCRREAFKARGGWVSSEAPAGVDPDLWDLWEQQPQPTPDF